MISQEALYYWEKRKTGLLGAHAIFYRDGTEGGGLIKASALCLSDKLRQGSWTHIFSLHIHCSLSAVETGNLETLLVSRQYFRCPGLGLDHHCLSLGLNWSCPCCLGLIVPRHQDSSRHVLKSASNLYRLTRNSVDKDQS